MIVSKLTAPVLVLDHSGIRLRISSHRRHRRSGTRPPHPVGPGQEGRRPRRRSRPAWVRGHSGDVDSSPLAGEVVPKARHVRLHADALCRLKGKYSFEPRVSPSVSDSNLLRSQAALIMGHPFRAVPVSVEDAYSLRGDALRIVMEEDRAAGLVRSTPRTPVSSGRAI